METRGNKQKTKVVDLDTTELELLIAKAVEAATKPLEESISGLMAEMSVLKEEIQAKDKRLNELEQRHCALEIQLDDLQQYGRRNNLRIFGVKEEANEMTDAIVMKLAKSVGVELHQASIDRSHRLGKPGGRPRPIIVKFVSYADRSLLFAAKKRLKGTEATIREDLTNLRLQVLREAVRNYTLKKVWTWDGVIKVNVGLRYPISVKSSEELQDLIGRYPPINE